MSVLGANVLETRELANSGVADAPLEGTVNEMDAGKGHISVAAYESARNSISKEVYEDTPTEEELQTLRRVSGKIPWTAWTIGEYTRRAGDTFAD